MSVYKPFTTSDVIVTPFKVNKSFTFYGKAWTHDKFTAAEVLNNSEVAINRFLGINNNPIPFIPGSNPTGQIGKFNEGLVYDSIQQLYYSNFVRGKDGSPVLTSSIGIDGVRTGQTGIQPMYDNYLPDTLLANRLFPTAPNDRIGVISIPTKFFGEYIKPGTFSLTYSGSQFSGTITDDENGNLLEGGSKVGDIIYQHGIAIITSYGTSITGSFYGGTLNSGYGLANYYSTGDYQKLNEVISGQNVKLTFQSTMTIHESQYKCTFNPNEFIYSQNPSIISSSCQNLEGKIWDFATSSYFEPYITTVGLYNNTNELVAVGKLSQPLQSSNVTDTTVLVNLDL